MTDVATFLDSVVKWSGQQAEIAAIALVGSHARGEARPDSDVDLVLLCDSPASLLAGDWLRLFGEVQSRVVEDYGPLKSLRVHYAHGLEVEFGIAARAWARVPLDAGTRRVLRDGARILHDPAKLLEAAMRDVGAAEGGKR